MNKKSLLSLLAVGALSTASAQVIFSDNFESGSLGNWTVTGSSPLAIDNAQNETPGGIFSAKMDISTDRMHNNIVGDNGGTEISGHSTFTSWIYDNGSTSRIFNEVRGYSGGTGLPDGGATASGSLSQLLAIGKYNTVTLGGEVFNGAKYQARSILGVNGWFNLDGAGSPNRSVGWHRFDIERLADDTTINYYVDGILSRTITGTGVQSWDTLILGPGLGSTAGDAWIDDMALNFGAPIVPVPEPSTIALGAMGVVGCLAAYRRRK